MVWVVQGEPGAGNGREEVDSSRVETAGVSTLGKGAACGHLLLRPHTPGFLAGPALTARSASLAAGEPCVGVCKDVWVGNPAGLTLPAQTA